MVVVLAYFVSDRIQGESGLLAVTVMGVALANQKFVSIRHILEFKENLRVLLISSLFIILAGRLSMSQLHLDDWSTWVFAALLILLVRPITVAASTIGSMLKQKDRLFLGWMAPRGIVAAAVSSVFGIRLVEAGVEGAEMLGPLTFQVIIVTVAVYGLTAAPVARSLKVAQPNPQGVLLAGAHSWARAVGKLLRDEGFSVAFVDSNWANVAEARQAGCKAYYGSILSEDIMAELQLDGIGRLLALTPNDEVNSLAALHFVDLFNRSDVYQLSPVRSGAGVQEEMPSHLRGRYLFATEATYSYMMARGREGAVVKKTPLTQEFDFAAYRAMYGPSALPMFVIAGDRELRVVTADSQPSPKPGQTLISLVEPPDGDSKRTRNAGEKPA
jgi:hypothetical protein